MEERWENLSGPVWFRHLSIPLPMSHVIPHHTPGPKFRVVVVLNDPLGPVPFLTETRGNSTVFLVYSVGFPRTV